MVHFPEDLFKVTSTSTAQSLEVNHSNQSKTLTSQQALIASLAYVMFLMILKDYIDTDHSIKMRIASRIDPERSPLIERIERRREILVW